jgi:hypothetical protein
MSRVSVYAADPGFGPGDKILFKAQDVFESGDTLYFPLDKSYGTTDSPIVVGSYGQGRAILYARGATAISFFAPGVAGCGLGYVIRDLMIRGDGPKVGGKNNLNGIMLWNSAPYGLEGFSVRNCEIHGFAGDGIATGRSVGKGRIGRLLINDCYVHDNPGQPGVAPHTGSGIIKAGSRNGLVEYCRAFANGANNDNPGGPIGIWMWDCVDSAIRS